MATTTRSALASIDTSNGLFQGQITGNLFAGEALDPVAPCYIKASDGLVYMSNGTAANEAATVFGFTPRAYAIGEAVTLLAGFGRARYGTGLTIGAKLFASATKGRLDDAATTGGTVAIARVISTTDITMITLGT